jgi:virulence-associated protein VapD
MYAIVFDLDTDILSKTYGEDNYTNAYSDIKKELEAEGFKWTQGFVYFGDSKKVDAVSCMTTVYDLAKKYSWFKASVRDIRMLKIEDNNNLMPVIERA